MTKDKRFSVGDTGGYVSDVKPTQDMRRAATAPVLTEPQKLGLGPQAYENLKTDQAIWERMEGMPNQSLISPMEAQLERNAQLKADLQAANPAMTDQKFESVLRDQSDWEGSVERGETFSKTNPIQLARMQAGLDLSDAASKPEQFKPAGR